MTFNDGGRRIGEDETELISIDRMSEVKVRTDNGGGFAILVGGLEASRECDKE
jgi:hypothetical protein